MFYGMCKRYFFLLHILIYMQAKFFCFDFDDLIVKLFIYNFKRKRFVYQQLGLFLLNMEVWRSPNGTKFIIFLWNFVYVLFLKMVANGLIPFIFLWSRGIKKNIKRPGSYISKYFFLFFDEVKWNKLRQNGISFFHTLL